VRSRMLEAYHEDERRWRRTSTWGSNEDHPRSTSYSTSNTTNGRLGRVEGIGHSISSLVL
jgi:hypothetical protein